MKKNQKHLSWTPSQKVLLFYMNPQIIATEVSFYHNSKIFFIKEDLLFTKFPKETLKKVENERGKWKNEETNKKQN